jgi:hypothetical protein
MQQTADQFRSTERFLIQARLGAGAFGVVYRAYDRVRNCVVALKTLRHPDPEALYVFKREFRSLADLVHPNLVTLYELVAEEGQLFFTMELIDGVNLREYLHGADELPLEDSATRSRQGAESEPGAGPPLLQNKPGDPERLRTVLPQLAEGVRTLHRAGKLHRDIKPSNIRVTPQGRVVLLDFGLVTDVSAPALMSSLALAGTPVYMAPELGAGELSSEASDWYAVGVILYEALTGQLPFGGNAFQALLEKERRDPVPPSEINPAVPHDLGTLCMDLLRRRPSGRPTGDEILRRLGPARGTPAAIARSSRPAASFVGRERELAALGEAFDATDRGRAVVVLCSGEAGVGKTALAHRFLDELRQKRPEAVVITGRCYEQESVPYKALDSSIDALARWLTKVPAAECGAILPRDILALARLFPVLHRLEAVGASRHRVLEIPDSQELRRRGAVALRELFARLADRKPVVLFIDDLHWGDPDSAPLLAELTRGPEPPALLLLACYRSEDASTSPLLRTLSPLWSAPAGGAEIRELALAALGPSDAHELARALLGSRALGADEAEAIARESGGSPLLIQELAQEAPAHVGAERRGSAAAPFRAADVIRSRVEALPEAARGLLEVIAVAGQPVSSRAAAEAAQAAEPAEAHLALLRAAHLIRSCATDEEDQVEVYHDRIRETVVAALSPDVLRDRHLRLALILEASARADPETLAAHFCGAGELDRASSHAESAAGAASQALAFDRAARLYRLALDLRGHGTSSARDIMVKLAHALVYSGRGAEAASLFLRAAQAATAAEESDLRWRAADQLLRSGHIEAGVEVLREVLRGAGLTFPRTMRGALVSLFFHRVRLALWRMRRRRVRPASADLMARADVCSFAAIGLSTVDTIRGAYFHAQHMRLAIRAGEPSRLSSALSLEAAFRAAASRRTPRSSLRLLRQSEELAREADTPYGRAFHVLMSGLVALNDGRWRECLILCDRAQAMFREECRGARWEISNAQNFSFSSLYTLGDIGELKLRVPRAIAEAEEHGDLYALLHHSAAMPMTSVLLAEDDPEGARARLEDVMRRWPRDTFQLQHFHELSSQCAIDFYLGRGSDALERIERAWPALKRSLLLRVQTVKGGLWFFRGVGALQLAREARVPHRSLLAFADRCARQVARSPMWGAPLVDLLQAGVALARGRREAAVALFARAESGLEKAEMVLFAAAARRRRGEILGGEEGRALCAAADAAFSERGVRHPERMIATLSP